MWDQLHKGLQMLVCLHFCVNQLFVILLSFFFDLCNSKIAYYCSIVNISCFYMCLIFTQIVYVIFIENC